MNENKIDFNISMLKRIREHLNFTLKEASKGITKTTKLSPVQVLESWEDGLKIPTSKQLKKLFDKTYRYPIYVIFDEEIPKEEKYFDYRSGRKNKELSAPEKRLLKEFETEMILKQKMLREISTNNNWNNLEFVGCFKNFENETPKTVVEKMYALLGIEDNYLVSHFKNDLEKTFKFLRKKLEDIGVFTFLFANLPTSTHSSTKLSPKYHFRGMACSDSKVPLIVINKDIFPAGKLFTIIHEFCHLLLGDKIIIAMNAFGEEEEEEEEEEGEAKRHREKENFCNDVASEFFISEKNFIENWKKLKNEKLNLNEKCERIGKEFGMSSVMVVTKAYKKRFCEKEEYREYCKEFYKESNDKKKFEKETKKGFFVKPQINAKIKLGNKFIDTIKEGYSDDLISWSDALLALGCDIDKFSEDEF